MLIFFVFAKLCQGTKKEMKIVCGLILLLLHIAGTQCQNVNNNNAFVFVVVESSIFELAVFKTVHRVTNQAQQVIRDNIKESILSSKSAAVDSIKDIHVLMTELIRQDGPTTTSTDGNDIEEMNNNNPMTLFRFLVNATFASQSKSVEINSSKYILDSLIVQTFSQPSSKANFLQSLQSSGEYSLEDVVGLTIATADTFEIDPTEVSESTGLSYVDIILITASSAIFLGILYIIWQHHQDRSFTEEFDLQSLIAYFQSRFLSWRRSKTAIGNEASEIANESLAKQAADVQSFSGVNDNNNNNITLTNSDSDEQDNQDQINDFQTLSCFGLSSSSVTTEKAGIGIKKSSKASSSSLSSIASDSFPDEMENDSLHHNNCSMVAPAMYQMEENQQQEQHHQIINHHGRQQGQQDLTAFQLSFSSVLSIASFGSKSGKAIGSKASSSGSTSTSDEFDEEWFKEKAAQMEAETQLGMIQGIGQKDANGINKQFLNHREGTGDDDDEYSKQSGSSAISEWLKSIYVANNCKHASDTANSSTDTSAFEPGLSHNPETTPTELSLEQSMATSVVEV